VTPRPFEVAWSEPAQRALRRLPEKVATAVVEFAYGSLADHPHRLGKALRLDLDGLHSARRVTSESSTASASTSTASRSSPSIIGGTSTGPDPDRGALVQPESWRRSTCHSERRRQAQYDAIAATSVPLHDEDDPEYRP
jgi:hypothetical protein